MILLHALPFCSYNQRHEAPDVVTPADTPYVPPSAPAPDTTPPANVSSVLITPAHQSIQLSWENPADGDLKGVRVYRATSAAGLDNAASRTLVCEQCSNPVSDTALVNGQTYYYKLVTYDQTGNAANGTQISATPNNNAITCDSHADNDCLQIATFNLEYFTSGFNSENSTILQQAKQAGAANIILTNGFDIVALQEIKDIAVFATWVQNSLGADWGYTISNSGCSARTGFIYKKSLVKLNAVQELSAPPFDSDNWDGCLRRPLQANFSAKHSTRQFRLITVHLKSGSDSDSCTTRQPQANNLSAYISANNATPTLLLGDLNDEVKASVGICSSIDTLHSIETNPDLKILTQSPTLESGLFTNIPYSSTIDHLVVNSAFEAWLHPARLTYTADIIAHNNLQISDHQPAFLWINLR